MDLPTQPALVAREPIVRVVLLNAGKSTRLGGQNKLFVNAGGVPVHRWHERALADHQVALVTRTEDIAQSVAQLPWLTRVVGHDLLDGPLGALNAYLNAFKDDDQIAVLYSDTLFPEQPISPGDWVGVAALSSRAWDYRDRYRGWVHQPHPAEVAVGLYAFADLTRLRDCIARLGTKTDAHLPELLNLYGGGGGVGTHRVVGWHDAGDPDALARVPSFTSR